MKNYDVLLYGLIASLGMVAADTTNTVPPVVRFWCGVALAGLVAIKAKLSPGADTKDAG